jgi:hypothetical protein
MVSTIIAPSDNDVPRTTSDSWGRRTKRSCNDHIIIVSKNQSSAPLSTTTSHDINNVERGRGPPRRRRRLWKASSFLLSCCGIFLPPLTFGNDSTRFVDAGVTSQPPLPVFIRISGGGGGNDETASLDDFNDPNWEPSVGNAPFKKPRRHPWVLGSGMEFSIFDSSRRNQPSSIVGRGGYGRGSNGSDNAPKMKRSDEDDIEIYDDNDDDDDMNYLMRMQPFRRQRQRDETAADSPLFRASYPFSNNNKEGSSSLQRKWRQQQRQQYQQQQRKLPVAFQQVQDWWMTNISPNIQSLPKIVCRVEPTTTLKLRKTFRPLKTIIRLGADFNTQLGVWQFKSSWEDAIIGGKLTLAMKELQFTKSWQLSVGAMEDLVTRLRFRAAINLQTFQAYARVGFRTERLTPINVVEGFTILKRVPLDGQRGSVKLEVKANVALPEPEIEYSTETQRSLIGMGDIEVSIDELNLLLDF